MSVVIRGMKMPKSCHQCVAGYGGFCFVCPAEEDGICPDHGRPEWCPLIGLPAQHGRLIDADALKQKQQMDADIFKGSTLRNDLARRDEALNAVANIVNAPTIICDGEACVGDCDHCGNRERAEAFKTLQTDYEDCRNELCLRCGDYKMAHLGACEDCRWKH